MSVVVTVLNSVGLTHVIQSFEKAGIRDIDELVQLQVSDYDHLGVTDSSDRKTLYYLIQRIKMEISRDPSPKRDLARNSSASMNKANDHEYSEYSNDIPEETPKNYSSISSSRSIKDGKILKQSQNERTPQKIQNKVFSKHSGFSAHASHKSKILRLSPAKDEKENEEDNFSNDSSPKPRNSSLQRALLAYSPQYDKKESTEYDYSIRNRSSSYDKKEKRISCGIDETNPFLKTPSRQKKEKSNERNRKDSLTDEKSMSSSVSSFSYSSTYSRSVKKLSTIPAEKEAPVSPYESKKKECPRTTGKKKSSSSSLTSENRRISAPVTTSYQLKKHNSYPRNITKSISPEGGISHRCDSSVSSRQSIASYSSRSRASSKISSANSDERSIASKRSYQVKEKEMKAAFVHGVKEDKSWGAQVAKLREENDSLYLKHDTSMDNEINDMRIRVAVRKRPIGNGGDVDVIHPFQFDAHGKIFCYQPKTRVDLTKEIETVKFSFDHVFDEGSTNLDIYKRTVKNLIPGAFEGEFGCVLAYGQSGSGKTFTMMGSNSTGGNRRKSISSTSNLGLYFLAAKDLFRLRKSRYSNISIEASLFEIYGGKLYDLLNKRRPIKCLENHAGRVCFPGLSEHSVSNANDLMILIDSGSENRSTGTTSANETSSRSHAILQLSLKKSKDRNHCEYGRMTFIDLAGSEKAADTSKASRTTRLEGAEINTSLLALKEVIRALAKGDSMAHVPFRGSKLTQVLKESFVGSNSRTVMIACVAPEMKHCEHTLNTLRYADRVKERDVDTGYTKSDSIVASSSIQKEIEKDFALSGDSKDTLFNEEVEENAFKYELDDDDWSSNSENSAENQQEKNTEYNTSFLHGSEEAVHSNTFFKNSSAISHSDQSICNLELRSSLDKDHKKIVLQNATNGLVTSHKDILRVLLTIAKEGMNCGDPDAIKLGSGDIESYIEKVELLQEKQLYLIKNLRESLIEYYASNS